MNRQELKTFFSREADILDRGLTELGVDASVSGVQSCGGSYVLYALSLGRSQRINGVQGILHDLSHRLGAARGRSARLRLRDQPLALEIEHPDPQPLSWRNATLGGHLAHTWLAGAEFVAGRRNDAWLDGAEYEAGQRIDVRLAFDDAPHVLIAGTTGSGKSTVLRSLLSSLCWSTSPAGLQLLLADLKNEDLVPYAGLPHCTGFAGSDREAQAMMARVEAELDRRIAGASTAQRIVVVVDELAQLPEDAKQRLGRLLALGRSKRVNVVAATQHPTAKLVGEKANYSVRLVGRVADAATSALCCGRPGIGCEMLPGRGAFVLVDGADVRRLQAYAFLADTADQLVAVISDRQGGVSAPVLTPPAPVQPVPERPEYVPEPDRTSPAPVLTLPVGGGWPLPMRPPTASEAAAIKGLAAGLSLNKIVTTVYGSKNGKTLGWVKGALQ